MSSADRGYHGGSEEEGETTVNLSSPKSFLDEMDLGLNDD